MRRQAVLRRLVVTVVRLPASTAVLLRAAQVATARLRVSTVSLRATLRKAVMVVRPRASTVLLRLAKVDMVALRLPQVREATRVGLTRASVLLLEG